MNIYTTEMLLQILKNQMAIMHAIDILSVIANIDESHRATLQDNMIATSSLVIKVEKK